MYQLQVTPRFEKDLKLIPKEIRERADEALLILKEDPFNIVLDTRKLKGLKGNFFRLRLRDYRLIYRLSGNFIELHRFRHRKDIYQLL